MKEYCAAARDGNFCPMRNKCKHYKDFLAVLSAAPIDGKIPPYKLFNATFEQRGASFLCKKLVLIGVN